LLFFNLCVKFCICILYTMKVVYLLFKVSFNLISLLEQVFNVTLGEIFQFLFIFFYIFFCFFFYFTLYSFIIFFSIYYI
jgi:hypothetical protein